MNKPVFSCHIKDLAILLIATSGTLSHASGTNVIVNGGFELPIIPGNFSQLPQSQVDGWSTTASDGEIEIWNRNFSGAPFAEGQQHAELNSTFVGELFQTVSGIQGGATVGFSFQHRGRDSIDTLRLTIIDLGPDGELDGVDDTTLFSNAFSAQPGIWVTHRGAVGNLTLGNPVRFGFESLEVTTPQNGNFLDDVQFGIGVGIPEPTSLALLVSCFVAMNSVRRPRS